MADYIIFFLLGIAVTFINSIAGGASSLSLPIMILLGLPPTIANGTNRLGMLAGIASSVFNMRRYGYFRANIAHALLPATLAGAVLGTLFAISMDNAHFQVLLTIGMVAVAIMSSMGIDPFGKPPEKVPEKPGVKANLAFATVGFYGGFLQVGMGFIQIFTLRKYCGLDLKQINAIKNYLSFWFILVSSVGFFWAGKVILDLAACMGAGCVLGGYLSSRFQHKHSQVWIKRIIQFSSIALAGKLLFDVVL